ncbi:MAG: glycosyltransferase [Nostoc sp. ChiSLP02]|nr:glycosyltransferase [Nostoc sp. DedSLP05]MDZ8098393.1 glycosyltransferase [Nostoc sp. DedSLP01]MDZ8188668.1 glycosyltransferase [Nostoc sp. ChiSLP02]
MNFQKTYTLAFIFTNFPPEVSGSAQYNWERVLWLAEQGMYHVVVLAPDCQKTASLPSVPSHLSDRLIIESYPSKPWLPYNIHYVPTVGAVKQINKRLADYKPHLITLVDVERAFLCASWQFPGKAYAKENKVTYITEYQTDYYNFAGSYPTFKFLRNIFVRPLTKYFYHQFDTTIVPSKQLNKHLQELGIQNSVFISFFGIDISLYSTRRRNRNFLNTCLTAEEKNNKVLLFLGRISFEKRVDLLIETFAQLKKRDDNYSLIIAGDGPSSAVNKLKSLAQSIPNIHFTGFIHGEAKANLLASCDLFCNPSPYETFGRTVVEAMASGIPVVAVDSGAVSEYMVNNVNGYLVQPDNVEEFARRIEEALSNDNTQIIQQALRDAAQLSSEQGSKNLNDYYQQLLLPMSPQKSLAVV